MEHADGDKCKIVFTTPEAMIEFSGEKNLKTALALVKKNLLTYVKTIVVWEVKVFFPYTKTKFSDYKSR